MRKHRSPKRPRGYWDDGANVERELTAWIEKYGTFPVTADFRRTGDTSLAVAISKTGGCVAWRVRLGHQENRKPKGYWKDAANIERELKVWIVANGRFPIQQDLVKSGRSDLARGVDTSGGFLEWRTRLEGVTAVMPADAKPAGYWQDEANVDRELRCWIREHGRFPVGDDLKHTGSSSLRAALSSGIGLRAWRLRLGYEVTRKPFRYWADEANVDRELRMWVELHGRFPTAADLQQTAHHSLSVGLNAKGFPFWRNRLGYANLKKSNGYWKDPANIERELRAWVEKHGKFPTTTDLTETGHTSLNAAIVATGFPVWKERLGFAPSRKPKGYWNDEANIERGLRAWIAEHGQFPSRSDLFRKGRNDIQVAVGRHGGLGHWRAKLGYGPITPACLREHADVLARVVMALDVADTASFWASLQSHWTMADLSAAIRVHEQEGTLERFRELLVAAD